MTKAKDQSEDIFNKAKSKLLYIISNFFTNNDVHISESRGNMILYFTKNSVNSILINVLHKRLENIEHVSSIINEDNFKKLDITPILILDFSDEQIKDLKQDFDKICSRLTHLIEEVNRIKVNNFVDNTHTNQKLTNMTSLKYENKTHVEKTQKRPNNCGCTIL